RHTRSKRDWSSDVCSSDLTGSLGITADLVRQNLKDIGLVQQQDCVPALGAFKDFFEVLAHEVGGDAERPGVNGVQRLTNDFGVYLGGQGLANAGASASQNDISC